MLYLSIMGSAGFKLFLTGGKEQMKNKQQKQVWVRQSDSVARQEACMRMTSQLSSLVNHVYLHK